MPACANCHSEWNWKESVGRMIWLEMGRKCPYCRAKQYPTTKTRQRMLVTSLFIPVPVILYTIFDTSFLTGVLIILALVYTQILTMPFFVELSNDREPLW